VDWNEWATNKVCRRAGPYARARHTFLKAINEEYERLYSCSVPGVTVWDIEHGRPPVFDPRRALKTIRVTRRSHELTIYVMRKGLKGAYIITHDNATGWKCGWIKESA